MMQGSPGCVDPDLSICEAAVEVRCYQGRGVHCKGKEGRRRRRRRRRRSDAACGNRKQTQKIEKYKVNQNIFLSFLHKSTTKIWPLLYCLDYMLQ